VLGFLPKEFETFAREYVVKRYSFVFLISDTALYWIPITFLFIAAFIAVTIRNKKKAATYGGGGIKGSGDKRWKARR